MKSNIDLTENRDFRKQNDLSFTRDFDSIRSSIVDLSKRRTFPWNQRSRLINFEWQERTVEEPLDNQELVLTGSSKEIISKRERINFYKGETCECCGKDLSRIPWHKRLGLCTTCNERLESSIRNDRPLWGNFVLPGATRRRRQTFTIREVLNFEGEW